MIITHRVLTTKSEGRALSLVSYNVIFIAYGIASRRKVDEDEPNRDESRPFLSDQNEVHDNLNEGA